MPFFHSFVKTLLLAILQIFYPYFILHHYNHVAFSFEIDSDISLIISNHKYKCLFEL